MRSTRLFAPFALLIALLFIFAAPTIARASGPSEPAAEEAPSPPPTTCLNPRSAVDIVFAWQQPGRVNLDVAARCLEAPGKTPAQRREIARWIKDVYDGRALLVDVPNMSEDARWLDPATGRHAVIVHPEIPDVVVERRPDGNWRWTAASIAIIEEMHSKTLARQIEERVPESLRGDLFGVQIWQYLALMLTFVVGLIARRIIHFVATRKLAFLEGGRHTRWVATLVNTIASPGATIVVATLLRVTYPQLGLPIGAALVMEFAVRTIVVLTVVWVSYRLVDVFSEWMAAKAAKTESKLDDQLVPLLRKSFKVVVVIVGTLLVLQNLKVDVGSLLAGLGIGGLAFALAARDTVANFFGSIMIFVDQPFQIGDWVLVDGAEGIVEEVGFRTTRIRSFDNSLITLPNAKFTEQKIVNFGARKYRRCFVTLNLTYDTTPEQMQAFVEGTRAIVMAHPDTRKDLYEIHMSGFGASSLDVMLYFFFEVPSWTAELEARHDVMLEIMRLAKKLGVSFAFPTRTLHLAEVPQPGAERVVPEAPSRDALADVVMGFGPDGKLGHGRSPEIVKGAFAPSTSVRGGDAGS